MRQLTAGFVRSVTPKIRQPCFTKISLSSSLNIYIMRHYETKQNMSPMRKMFTYYLK